MLLILNEFSDEDVTSIIFDRINKIYRIKNLKTNFLAHSVHPEILSEN